MKLLEVYKSKVLPTHSTSTGLTNRTCLMVCREAPKRLPALVQSGLCFLCFLLIVASYAPTAFAIGDSGGCSGDGFSEVKAATEGDATTLLAAIWAKVDHAEKSLPWTRRVYFSLSNASRREWRESAAKSLADGVPISACGNRKSLLELAVWSGNSETTSALLDLGANPNAPRFYKKKLSSHLFLGCDNVFEITKNKKPRIPVEKQIVALKLVLAAGGDINLRTPGDRAMGALHVCGDPAILRFYLENGADPLLEDYWGETPIERAISSLFFEYLPNKEDYNVFYKVQEEQMRALLDYGKVFPRAKVMQRVREKCGLERNERACAILVRLFPELKGYSTRYQISVEHLIP